MKKTLLMLFLLAGNLALSQTEVYKGFSVWSQRMDMSQYIGKNYRISLAIRAETDGLDAAAYGFIRNEYEKMGPLNWIFMDNMAKRPVRNNAWKTYTIQSKVAKKAPWIGFGFLSIGNGHFYFDDLHLSVETKPGIWTPIPIANGDFEGEILEPWMQTSQGVPVKVHGAKAELSDENPFEGKQCLKVTNKLLVKE